MLKFYLFAFKVLILAQIILNCHAYGGTTDHETDSHSTTEHSSSDSHTSSHYSSHTSSHTSSHSSSHTSSHSYNLFHLNDSIDISQVCWCFLILVGMTIIIEGGVHWLEDRLQDQEHYIAIVNKVYKELMILGLISFTLFCFEQGPALDDVDHSWIISFEFSHILIFFVGIAFSLLSIVITLIVVRSRSTWEQYESHDLDKLMNDFVKRKNVVSQFFYSVTSMGNAVHFMLLKHIFIKAHHLPEGFHFQEYVQAVMLSNVDSVLDVEMSSWFTVALATCLGAIINASVEHGSDHESFEARLLVMATFLIPGFVLMFIEFGCVIIVKNAVVKVIESELFIDKFTMEGAVNLLRNLQVKKNNVATKLEQIVRQTSGSSKKSLELQPLSTARKQAKEGNSTVNDHKDHILVAKERAEEHKDVGPGPGLLHGHGHHGHAHGHAHQHHHGHGHNILKGAGEEIKHVGQSVQNAIHHHRRASKEHRRASKDMKGKQKSLRVQAAEAEDHHFKKDKKSGFIELDLSFAFPFKSVKFFQKLNDIILLMKCLYLAIFACYFASEAILFENPGTGAIMFILMLLPIIIPTFYVTPLVFQTEAILTAVAHVQPSILGQTLEKMMNETQEMRATLVKQMRELLGGEKDKASLEKMFNDLDANKDGTISTKEFEQGLGKLNMYYSPHQFKALIHVLNPLGGRLHYEHFVEMIFPSKGHWSVADEDLHETKSNANEEAKEREDQNQVLVQLLDPSLEEGYQEFIKALSEKCNDLGDVESIECLKNVHSDIHSIYKKLRHAATKKKMTALPLGLHAIAQGLQAGGTPSRSSSPVACASVSSSRKIHPFEQGGPKQEDLV